MKLGRLTILALLPYFAICRVLPPLLRPYVATSNTSFQQFDGIETRISSLPKLAADNPITPSVSFWLQYVCRGRKLHNACRADRDHAAEFVTPIDATFDTTLQEELKYWGYREHNEEAVASCWFHILLPEELTTDLGFDPLGSDHGGPNECFMFLHYDEEADERNTNPVPISAQTYQVGDKQYRATGAKATIGANAQDGIIFFLNVVSALEGAKRAWGVDNPPFDQLPELRQISDMAWGIWRRKHSDGQGLSNINKFLVNHIVNPTTKELIAEALRTYAVGEGQTRETSVPLWPGLTFSMDSEQGLALLGSPNGIAVGYFLSQHKTQFGGNKQVEKVQVFLIEDDDDSLYMVFHVSDVPRSSRSEHRDEQTPSVDSIGFKVKRSADGRNVIREHVIKARL